jgi:hypothetical protein
MQPVSKQRGRNARVENIRRDEKLENTSQDSETIRKKLYK